MGYSDATVPIPMLPPVQDKSLPHDWWDPSWQAAQTPGVTGLGPAISEPAEPAAAATEPESRPEVPAVSPPSWGQIVTTTFGLWAGRHLPWLRGSSWRLLAASALGAGLVAVAAGTAGVAIAALSPTSVPLPAKPAPIPAPTARTVLPASLATVQQPAKPAWLSIPSLGIRTSLVHLGLTETGALQVPATTTVAGWYTGGPRPGAPGGAVIAGHVDSKTGVGIFFWLRTLRPGDQVYVGRANGTMAVFTVTDVETYAKDKFPTEAVYGPVPDAELRLITCGGSFDRSTGSYLSNIVVFARLTG
jgi:sortase (surface protein transpeptidase)